MVVFFLKSQKMNRFPFFFLEEVFLGSLEVTTVSFRQCNHRGRCYGICLILPPQQTLSALLVGRPWHYFGHTEGMSMSLVYLGSLFTVVISTVRVLNSKFWWWQVSVVVATSEMTAVEFESVLESVGQEAAALSKYLLFSYITTPRPRTTITETKTSPTLLGPLHALELNSWATSRSLTVCK